MVPKCISDADRLWICRRCSQTATLLGSILADANMSSADWEECPRNRRYTLPLPALHLICCPRRRRGQQIHLGRVTGTHTLTNSHNEGHRTASHMSTTSTLSGIDSTSCPAQAAIHTRYRGGAKNIAKKSQQKNNVIPVYIKRNT